MIVLAIGTGLVQVGMICIGYCSWTFNIWLVAFWLPGVHSKQKPQKVCGF